MQLGVNVKQIQFWLYGNRSKFLRTKHIFHEGLNNTILRDNSLIAEYLE
jgi:hypothetical protein